MLRKQFVLMCLAVSLVSCTGNQKESPQKTLKDYVERSFKITKYDERKQLEELTTGFVKDALEGMTREEFDQTFVKEKRNLIGGIKIRDERKLADDRYSITYELSYESKSENSQDKVTNKKHAIMRFEGGKWLIADVQNLKTYIERDTEFLIQAEKHKVSLGN